MQGSFKQLSHTCVIVYYSMYVVHFTLDIFYVMTGWGQQTKNINFKHKAPLLLCKIVLCVSKTNFKQDKTFWRTKININLITLFQLTCIIATMEITDCCCLTRFNAKQMQYFAIICNILPYFAIYCQILPYIAIYCHILPYFAIFCNILQYFAIFCNIMQYFAILCNILQHFAIFYNVLPYFAIFCNILPYFAILCHILLYFAIFCNICFFFVAVLACRFILAGCIVHLKFYIIFNVLKIIF